MFNQTEEQQKKDFKNSVIDGSFFVLKNTIALNFLVPYILLLGAKPIHIGLIDTLPFLVSSFFMLFAHKLFKYFNSKKSLVVFFVTLQSLIWVPIAFTHFSRSLFIVWIIILLYILEFSLGKAIHPIYTDWIKKIFLKNKISRMLSKKNIVLQMVSIFPIVIIGYLLDIFNAKSNYLLFTYIFLFAALCRFLSSRYLNKMSKTEDKKEMKREYKMYQKPIFKIFRKEVLKDKVFFHYLIFIFLIFFGMYFGTSYLKYYLLDVLNFTYTKYVWFQVAFVLGHVFSLSYWGFVSDKFGALKIIKVTSLFIPFFLIVHFYLAQISFGILLFWQFFAGTVLAGFYLAIVTYMYQNTKSDFINHMSFMFIFQAIAMVLGSTLGGLFIGYFETIYSSIYSVFLVFIITMVLRSIGVIYGILNLKDKKRSNINFLKDIFLLRSSIYGIKGFFRVLSVEEKKLLKKHLIVYSFKLNMKFNKEKIMKFIKNIEKKERDIIDKINHPKK